MMEDKEYTVEEERKFIKGFNEGYMLREHRPDLLKALISGLSSNNMPHLDGIRAGSVQREKEMTPERIRNTIERGNKGIEKFTGRDRTDD